MKNKVLVTGGAGYIGAHTVAALDAAGYEVVIADDFSKSDETLLKGLNRLTKKKPTFFRGDCADKEFLTNLFKGAGPFKCVLHFAAFKSVGESVQKPLTYFQNNLGSLIVLLETMKENNVSDMIFSSSCTVYGQPDHIPVDETAPFKPAESPYGATKQMCERILQDSFKLGFRFISLRYFNPIGAHPTAEIGELPISVPNNLVPYITQTAAGIREKLVIFGNDYDTPDGTCLRDFIHVSDVAIAHVRAMEYLETIQMSPFIETFNLGTGVGVSVLQLVNEFMKVTGQPLKYVIGPRRPGDVEKVYANPDKVNRTLNWKTKYSLQESLLHAWQWEKKIRHIA